ncbi:S-crystallin [Parasponia andersonii]|uniref:S-crystallin n=1 Tax=Parasponia andersonii TaxID=3476 RepID=A0A2P5BIX3_PARAD|nr:S-crystallin [Parasponia andersonii]
MDVPISYAGVKIEVAANFELGVTNKTPEFLKMNPIGKIPVLETPDDPIFESIAISRYGFWDTNDPEGYSLWFCDYKYNDDNTVSFVNLIEQGRVGGFLQRMDLARKYAFGKMLVIGSEPPIQGEGAVSFDMELYDWNKVDLSDEAQKEPVNQMIEDAEPFEGEALLDAKC